MVPEDLDARDLSGAKCEHAAELQLSVGASASAHSVPDISNDHVFGDLYELTDRLQGVAVPRVAKVLGLAEDRVAPNDGPGSGQPGA